MRLLVCGDRNWVDYEYICVVLSQINAETPITLLIEGEARGADRMAAQWAEANGIPVAKFPADWETYHRGAGPRRNIQMINEGRPDRVVAFHNNLANSKGTAHMVKTARGAGIMTEVFSSPRFP